MRIIQTLIRNPGSFTQRRLVCALLIAGALVAVNHNTATTSARSVPTESTVVLDTANAPSLQGTYQVIHADPGNETNAHVDCDVVAYTLDDFRGRSTIRYQNLSTGIDTEVPGNEVDLLSNISGSRIAFTEVTYSGDTVRIFDTNSQTTTIVPGFHQSNPSIGGNLVAFDELSSAAATKSDITTYDLISGTVTKLTDDSFDNRSPKVTPNGDAVVWPKCTSNVVGCDIYVALRTSPGVFTIRALTTGNHESRYETSANGEYAVYVSDRTGERDIYYQPLTGGTEVHLAIPGDQRNPTVSGDLISFESGSQSDYDIFVYDIRSERLFRATNALPDDRLSAINVCGDTGRIVYVNVGDGAFDLYGFTFQLPGASADVQLHDLIAIVRSFNLAHGIANSLIRKLQNAIDALNTSDTATACSSVTAFINECQAQSGKKLSREQSAQLINSANEIKTSLGCP